jgi:solute:Na+ symporter, SSS family
MPETSFPVLIGVLVALAVASLLLVPRTRTAEGFFLGHSPQGMVPGIWTLTFSQVTTWIFARSLLNAGILGYFYGIAGALAYTAYYGSFLTGWWIVDRLRFHHGATNIQSFLARRFGRLGTGSFNLLISLRLLSEVFANLLVVGIVFGATGSVAYSVAILAVAAVTLGYSMVGGLHASLRTDVLQFSVLAVLLGALFVVMLVQPGFDAGAIVASSPDFTSPGWVLLVVALLQVTSYPMHDPVMMDRGFLADRDTTRRSFLHAFWISSLLILAFGLLGVFAGLQRSGGEELLETLARLLGAPAMLLLGTALVISAASTMDSTFSSAAKLAVVDMGLGRNTARNGRIAMALFALGGLLLVFVGTNDLFAAVAVSGTASLFLTPVIVYCIGLDRAIQPWAYRVNFLVAVGASIIYFLENSGHVGWIGALTGVEHSYGKLLVITLVVLAVGFASFALGMERRRHG